MLICLLVTLIFSISYNFLSFDLFANIFFAKITWSYHLNPYFIAPKDFAGKDLIVSFVRSIDGTYRYGVLYLGFSIIPLAIFGAGRFILIFLGLKILNALVFFLTGLLIYELRGKDKLVFSLWFFNPLLLIEFLTNAHNDLLMISWFILSVYFLVVKQRVKSYLSFTATLFTKSLMFFSNPSILGLPAFFITGERRGNYFKLLSLGLFIFLQTSKWDIQIWYFTWIYLFLPFLNLKKVSWILIYLIGLILLVGYFPFLLNNTWTNLPFITNLKYLIWASLLGIIISERYPIVERLVWKQ